MSVAEAAVCLRNRFVGRLCEVAGDPQRLARCDGYEQAVVLVTKVERQVSYLRGAWPMIEIEGIVVEYLLGERVEIYWARDTELGSAEDKILACFLEARNKHND